MCSRLHVRLSTGTREISPGGPIPYRPAGETKVQEGLWGTSFGARVVTCARSETFRQKWLPYGWQPCRVPVSDFAEGHDEVRWAGIQSGEMAALHRGTEVVLVTRDATSLERARLHHHRVPVQVKDGRMVLPQKSGGSDWFGQ